MSLRVRQVPGSIPGASLFSTGKMINLATPTALAQPTAARPTGRQVTMPGSARARRQARQSTKISKLSVADKLSVDDELPLEKVELEPIDETKARAPCADGREGGVVPGVDARVVARQRRANDRPARVRRPPWHASGGSRPAPSSRSPTASRPRGRRASPAWAARLSDRRARPMGVPGA